MDIQFNDLTDFSKNLHLLKDANFFDSDGEPNNNIAEQFLQYLDNYIDNMLKNAKIYNDNIFYDSELIARNLIIFSLKSGSILTNFSIVEELVRINDALND